MTHSDIDYIDTWAAMVELVQLGLVRSIGVSNFNMDQLQRIIQCSSMKPVVNQVEVWPGFMQKDLVDYCRYNGITVIAYSPLGNPNREEHKPIYFFSEGMKRLVKKYNRTASQIVLRYLVGGERERERDLAYRLPTNLSHSFHRSITGLCPYPKPEIPYT